MSIVVFLGALVLVYIIWCQAIRHVMKKLICTRAFSRTTFFAGEEGELHEVIRNDSPVIIPWLLVESRISSHLRLGKQDNLQLSGDTHFCSQFTLLSHQQIHRRHRVRFLHRGNFNLGNASLTAGNVLGFFACRSEQNLDAHVLVYPPLLGDSQLPLPISCHLREVTSRPQLLTDPFLVRGLRAYQPGDPVRDIHWAATARTGETQVRLHDYSARTQLLVVLNCQLQKDQWHPHLGDGMAEKIEYGISLAATVCLKALGEGLAVGFAANMPMDNEKESVVLLPGEGDGWDEQLLTTFARLRILRTEYFPQFLDTLTHLSGMDILVLSAYDSEGIDQSLGKLRRSGNRVTLHLLEGGDAWNN